MSRPSDRTEREEQQEHVIDGQQTIYDQLDDAPTHGSLFSGYGGIDLAVAEVFGARTAWVSDIEPGPCRVLDARFPGVPNLGDITAVDWADVPPVDILSGGTPCQDLSAAGRRAGMTEGTRSNLWVQMREAIATLRPRLVVWENVMGALSARATSELESSAGHMGAGADGPVLRALGRVLGDLAEIGFHAEWATVRASDVGAPHGRARVFLLAWPAGTTPHTMRSRGGRGAAQPEPTGSDDAPVGSDQGGDGGRRDPVALLPTPRASDHTGPIVHGEGGLDLRTRVTLLPTPRASDGAKGGPNQRGSKGDLTMSSAAHQLAREKISNLAIYAEGEMLAEESKFTDFGDYTPAIERWERTTGRPAPEPTKPSPRTGKQQLSAEFVEWMMGLPAGWFTDPELGLSRVEQLRIGGNGVVPQQAAYTIRGLLDRTEEGRAAA